MKLNVISLSWDRLLFDAMSNEEMQLDREIELAIKSLQRQTKDDIWRKLDTSRMSQTLSPHNFNSPTRKKLIKSVGLDDDGRPSLCTRELRHTKVHSYVFISRASIFFCGP